MLANARIDSLDSTTAQRTTCQRTVPPAVRVLHAGLPSVDFAGDVCWLLCFMGVAGALEHLQVGADVAAQAALGKHALDSALNDALW
eukprot:scaffold145906_cov14-Tisochrysis_lutea.AAC.1